MKIKYFADTDTALLQLSEQPPKETREINENLYVDLDERGRVVSVTIEHAYESARMGEFSYQVIPLSSQSAGA